MQLLFHAGPLDEFMLLMPLLRAMDQPMTVVAPWERASLASRMLGTTPMDIALFEFTRLHSENGPSRISPAVSDLFTSATRIVSFLSADNDNWAKNVRKFAPDSWMIRIDPRPPAQYAGHFTDWHRTQLAEQGFELAPVQPAPIDNPTGPVVVHPGGKALKRCWPAERYEALIQALRKLGITVTPVIGAVELERWSPQRLEHWTSQLRAVTVRSAEALLPLMNEARLFIGNDAGPAHIAAQLGTPTLAILGPTDPTKTAPRGKHIRTLGPPDGPGRIEDVTLDAVIQAANLI